MNRTKFSLFTAICASLMLGCSVGPPSVVYHQAPPSASVASSQNQIDDLIRKGDDAYDNENFVAAKSYYYQAMLAQSNPTPYVLASYGLALSQLGNFDNAQEIFKMAEAKYPNNEIIQKGIAISNRIFEEQMEQQRQMELEMKRQEAESTANKMREFGNALQDLADAVDAYQGGHQKSESSSNATSYSSNQGSNNNYNSSNASSSKRNNYNCANAYKKYDYARGSAESISKIYYDDPEGHQYGGLVAKNNFKNAQANMRRIREEAQRNGCNGIYKSDLETKVL